MMASETPIGTGRRLALIARASQLLLAADDTIAQLSLIYDDIAGLLGTDSVFHYRLEPASNALRLAYASGASDAERFAFSSMNVGEFLCGRVAESRKRLITEDLRRTHRTESELFISMGNASYAGFPLVAGGKLLGTVAFVARTPTRFAEGDIETVQTLCDLVAVAMERASLQNALTASEGMFRGIFNHARTGIVMTDIEDRFMHCNPAYEQMIGTHTGALHGLPVSEFVHPDDRRENETLMARLRDGEIEYFEAVSRFVRRSGEVIWVHKYVSLLPTEEENPQGFLKLITDITGIKQQEQALAASEERFRALASTVPTLIFVTDAQGENIYLNSQFENFTGREAKDLLGNRWLEVVHPDDRTRVARTWEICWRSGRNYVVELRLHRRDGAWRSFYSRGHPVRDQMGEIVQWVGTCTEIQHLVDVRDELAERGELLEAVNDDLERLVLARTAELREANLALQEEIGKREAAQAALLQSQKLEALGQLSSGIAHDFNNILAAISGGYELIARRIDDPFVSDIARQCNEAAHRGAQLVKQMLAFAREQTLAPRPVDLAALAGEIEPLIRRAIPGTTVHFEFAQDLPMVMVDPVQLETALLNLAVNARDAMDGRGELTIGASQCLRGASDRPSELGDHDVVEITVRDNGAGMSQEILQRVTEPFFTTKPPGKGTGLGLAMVYGFLGQSGGAMRIESTPGEGTTVRLYLRCADETAERESRPEEDSAISGQARLLLVDDEEPVRLVTAAQLREFGYTVVEAGSLDEALGVIDTDAHFDCVITDVVMPGGDGIDLAEEIRQRKRDMPFVFMTGLSESHRVKDKPHIAKPFRIGALTREIAGAINGSGQAAYRESVARH